MSVWAITTCTSRNRQTYVYPDPYGQRSGNYQESGMNDDTQTQDKQFSSKKVVFAPEDDSVRTIHLVALKEAS